MVLGLSDKGLCWLGFMVKGYKGDGLERMRAHLRDVSFIRDDLAVQAMGDAVVQAWESGSVEAVPLDLRGTDFQQRVWQALLKIGRGRRLSYGDVANDIGRAHAARAVGSAVGENPVSLLVPCHRVVRADGSLGNYGWGLALKERILARETE
ncbi:MAG: methylated-DNA--[protein]-cysteine S-methyltransferase [Alphaproteobacteria bacterium]|nr:methylated-DNA--[protein]-cysteine S-methyltransferase [Alphaproteobacteria bacterium]